LYHRVFSNEDVLVRRYYIPLHSLTVSDAPDCGTVGGDDEGDEDIEVSSGCKRRWRSLNSKEESGKSDEEEVHWERFH
jgi:hypothetical protein